MNVHVAAGGKYIGTITLNDTLKENTIPVIEKLKLMGIKLTLLSGDKEDNVKEIGEKSGC